MDLLSVKPGDNVLVHLQRKTIVLSVVAVTKTLIKTENGMKYNRVTGYQSPRSSSLWAHAQWIEPCTEEKLTAIQNHKAKEKAIQELSDTLFAVSRKSRSITEGKTTEEILAFTCEVKKFLKIE
jgi:hypothetical protein